MSCLCNSAEGAPMPPASAPPRSHIDPFLSWYYLNSWLWTSGTTVTPTGPWHSLSILLDHLLPICSPSKHPACSPSPSPHSPTERSEETLHQLLTTASTSSPPWATPRSEHPSSILWQLCPLLSCIFKASFFKWPFPSAHRYYAVMIPTFREEMSVSTSCSVPSSTTGCLGNKTPQKNSRFSCLISLLPFLEPAPIMLLTLYAQTLSHVWPFGTPRTVTHQVLCPCNSPGKNAGVGCCSLLQGVFPSDPLFFWDSSRQDH